MPMATEAEKQAPPAKKGGLIILVVVGVLAAGAGFAVPRLLVSDGGAAKPDTDGKKSVKPALLPFGEVVVSLGEERLTRYLRAKIILVVEGSEEKEIKEHLEKQKAYLKSWLIGYLSDLTLNEVSRAAGVNRLRREIRDQFNALLWPEGQELVLEVLFDEFVVQ
jgi:flagellar basal body-associated protein FliL